MSFRGRLRLFFTIIVVVPMVAVALVLFTLTAQSETGKADAGIAIGLRNAFRLYGTGADRSQRAVVRLSRDDRMNMDLLAGRRGAARARIRTFLRANPRVVSVEFYPASGRRPLRVGSRRAIAPASVVLRDGRRRGTLQASVTRARRYVRMVKDLSGLEVSVFRGGRRLATTLPGRRGSPERGPPNEVRNFEADGSDYRGRVERISQRVGPPLDVAVFQDAHEVSSSVADSRLLIGLILLAFLVLALASSVFVVGALQGQIGQFLEAARRLARGDFRQLVPTQGGDEFAALGREFNKMSEQLAAKIEEVEHKRHELEETIRRVGAAFAAGLDRQGVVELAVVTAVDACEAEAGRALPLDSSAFRESRTGRVTPALRSAIEAAERKAFNVRPNVGIELMDPPDAPPQASEPRRAVEARVDGAHALAVPMLARLGSRRAGQYVGVVSIARHVRGFNRQEEELLEYLAAQAVVSIENADLHETVQRQAVTDELTGLANRREFDAAVDREIERSRRSGSPFGLVILDLDDFKQVNDEHGHPQGDEVLVAVAHVLQRLSRDIDVAARIGGEELAVVLPQTDSKGAFQAGERMREAIEGMGIHRIDGRGEVRITASFGVASFPSNGDDAESLFAAADEALFRAKRSGKNRGEQPPESPA